MFIRLKIKLYTLTIPILKIEQKWVLELSKGVTYIDKCFSDEFNYVNVLLIDNISLQIINK